MKTFSDLLEAPQTIVFAFGRFNPPTTGHEKLINKVASVAGNVPYRIYPSFTTNPKKDPLPHALKVAYMRKMFPKHRRNIIADKNAKTAIHIAEMLYKEGFKNLVMVVGSDRLKEFSTLLNRYNDAPDKSGKQLFKFDTVQVISAGERDPDAEGVSGMSASKMRAAATNGDKDAFLTGLPSGFKDGEKLYRDVRKYMGIREERDMGDMTDFENVRDMFLTGKIWNAGDIVEANGVIGEVVRKGTNYLSFVDEDGKVHKAWLHEITIDEEGISPALRRALDRKPMPQRYRVFDSKGEEVTVVQGPMKTKSSIDAFERRVKDKFIYTNPPYTVVDTKTNKVERIIEEVELDERNYRKEYDNYHSRPEQIARRSSRNQARRIMGDRTKIGMDVGHKDNNPMNNSPENLRNEDPSKNRREPRLREMDEDLESTFPWLGKLKRYLFTKTHKKGMDKVAMAVATEYAKQRKTNKTPNVMNIIHGIVKNISDVTDRMARDYINDLVKQGKLPKDLRAEYEVQSETMSFKDFVNQIQINEKLGKNADAGDYIDDFMKSDAPQFKGKSKEKRKDMAIAAYLDKKDKSEGAYGYEKQDPDIEGKKGTQPAKYHKGLSKSTKQKRDAHFKAKKKGPAPGDATGKTKPSVHTKKFKQMYGEDGPCWDTHKQVGMKKKGGRMVPNCVPKNEEPRIPRKKGQPAGSDKHSDLYTDENPKGTIHGLGFKDVETAKASVKKIIGSGKTHAHKIQAAIAMEQRAKEMGKTAEAAVYRKYIDKMKKKTKKMQEGIKLNEWGEITEKAEYDGKSVDLNNPTKGDTKKYKVYVRNDKGNIVKVEFGDPNMEIKRDDPARRKNFRARHNCDNPGPKWKARYWSCKFWSAKSVTDLMKG